MTHKKRVAGTIARLYMDAAYFMAAAATVADPEGRVRWTNDAQDMLAAAWRMAKRNGLERAFTYADYYARRGNIRATRAAAAKATDELTPAVARA